MMFIYKAIGELANRRCTDCGAFNEPYCRKEISFNSKRLFDPCIRWVPIVTTVHYDMGTFIEEGVKDSN